MNKILSAVSVSLLLMVSTQANAQPAPGDPLLAHCTGTKGCTTGYLNPLNKSSVTGLVADTIVRVQGSVRENETFKLYKNKISLINCSRAVIFTRELDYSQDFTVTVREYPGVSAKIEGWGTLFGNPSAFAKVTRAY